uniref:Ig-like domain-containing protein n=1 Tax=Hucho hucho TaxID=62062 RepID=A0A4W5P7R9_9TELE
MVWLDSSGTILPADGPPERYRVSEDLYTVRQHVTVDQTDTNTFTCIVQQPEINHKKETEIHVPDLKFPKSQLIFGLLTAAVVVVLLAVGLYKWRKRIEEKKLRKRLKNLEQHVKDFKLARDERRDARVVDMNRFHLIQTVTTVIPIAFYLIRSKKYSEIHAARTRQDQIKLLYEALDSGSRKLKKKSDFYRILLDLEPDAVISCGAKFVDDHKYYLIQKVTLVKPIIYELFYELYCNPRTSKMNTQDQMRQLYQALEEAEDTRRFKSDFYRILLHPDPRILRDLGKNLSTSGYISLEYKPYLVYHLGKNLSTSSYISLEYKPV